METALIRMREVTEGLPTKQAEDKFPEVFARLQKLSVGQTLPLDFRLTKGQEKVNGVMSEVWQHPSEVSELRQALGRDKKENGRNWKTRTSEDVIDLGDETGVKIVTLYVNLSSRTVPSTDN